MVQIECLICGSTIDIPDFIDTSNYDGQISCRECTSLLQVKLVGEKVRGYRVIEKGSRNPVADYLKDNGPAAAGDKLAGAGLPGEAKINAAKIGIDNIASYNVFRDYLSSYRASQLQLSFEQIENVLGFALDTAAYTFKTWWDNDRNNPQAIAWLEAGWQTSDIDLPQQVVIFKRMTRTV